MHCNTVYGDKQMDECIQKQIRFSYPFIACGLRILIAKQELSYRRIGKYTPFYLENFDGRKEEREKKDVA